MSAGIAFMTTNQMLLIYADSGALTEANIGEAHIDGKLNLCQKESGPNSRLLYPIRNAKDLASWAKPLPWLGYQYAQFYG